MQVQARRERTLPQQPAMTGLHTHTEDNKSSFTRTRNVRHAVVMMMITLLVLSSLQQQTNDKCIVVLASCVVFG